MIEEFLLWVQLHSLSYHLKNLVVTNQNQSDIILLLYVVSFRRSWLFATAFFACTALSAVNLFGVTSILYELEMYEIYGAMHYMILLAVWCLISIRQIKGTNNKNLAVACCIMIALFITLAADRYANAYDKTWLYANSPNIIVCVHAFIILSLYKPISIINSVVGKLRLFMLMLRDNYSVSYFCYTIQNWQDKRLL